MKKLTTLTHWLYQAGHLAEANYLKKFSAILGASHGLDKINEKVSFAINELNMEPEDVLSIVYGKTPTLLQFLHVMLYPEEKPAAYAISHKVTDHVKINNLQISAQERGLSVEFAQNALALNSEMIILGKPENVAAIKQQNERTSFECSLCKDEDYDLPILQSGFYRADGEYHRQIGLALGYPAADVEEFVAKFEERKDDLLKKIRLYDQEPSFESGEKDDSPAEAL